MNKMWFSLMISLLSFFLWYDKLLSHQNDWVIKQNYLRLLIQVTYIFG
jgi:hypothetical protein